MPAVGVPGAIDGCRNDVLAWQRFVGFQMLPQLRVQRQRGLLEVVAGLLGAHMLHEERHAERRAIRRVQRCR